MESKIIQGDCLEIMRTFPAESIDMCITSPPYWGLRDYGNEQIFGGEKDCEHEWTTHTQPQKGGRSKEGSSTYKKWLVLQDGHVPGRSVGIKSNFCQKCKAWRGQLGLEPTPEMYIEHLTEIFNEVKRVLKKEGTLWLNIGDTYGGSGGDGSKKIGEPRGGGRGIDARPVGIMGNIRPPQGKLTPKCLLMVPERLAWSLIQDGWILRNKIIWYKPNAMPASVTDRFNNRWEYVYLFSKSKKYYFDLDAVREPHHWSSHDRYRGKYSGSYAKNKETGIAVKGSDPDRELNPLGKNPGDVWAISTKSFPEAHFAVFPEKLCEKPIGACCPENVCRKCRKARERITKRINVGEEFSATAYPSKSNVGALSRKRQACRKMGIESSPSPKTVGWTSCECNAGFEPGIVLDPFAGAGTVGVVAKMLGRRYVLIDIKREYCSMAKKRIIQVGYQKELF